MDIDVFLPCQLETVMRVLRTALDPEGPLGPPERRFLETFATIAGHRPGAGDPLPIDAVAVRLEGGHRRKRLLQLSALAVLLARPLRPASLAFLHGLATALEVRDPVIGVIDALAKGRLGRVRLLAMRRGLRAMVKEAWLAEGASGVARLIAAMAFKAAVNPDRLWRYRQLGLLADDTLGRRYWTHMTREGFGFPGDVAGIADSVAYHDVVHVLADHPATPQGEILQGSFQGGNRREDGFFFVQFVVLHFHHGVRITPGAPPATGHFDPAAVLWAIHRGAMCSVDMTHQWDFWPLMPLPIEQARERIGLLPKRYDGGCVDDRSAARTVVQ